MNDIITESNMNFIADNAFYIEKSPIYTGLGKNVKSVEFIRSKGHKLFFVEAKSSFPDPSNPNPNPKKDNKTGKELFKEEIIDICDKFVHTLNLYSAVNVGVIENGFPAEFNPSQKVSLVFVLVINGFHKSWCDEVERALANKLRESICIDKIWKPEISVLNHEEAIKRKLSIA